MVFLWKIGNRLRSTTSSVSFLRRYSLPAKKDDFGWKDKLQMIDQRKLPTDYDPSNFDPTEHRTPPSERVWGLVDEVSALTLEEVAELSGILMRKAGLSEPPVIGVMKPGTAFLSTSAAGPGTSVAKELEKPEKTTFELKLESFEAASKIKVIKEVRALTDLGLKEAKELVEKTPTVIKIGVSKEEAEQIIEKMMGAGAKVIME